MKRVVRIFAIAVLSLILVLSLLEVYIANELASMGARVGAMDKNITDLHEKNESMGEKVASHSSLLVIETQAKLLGFVEPSKQSFLILNTNQLPVAMKP